MHNKTYYVRVLSISIALTFQCYDSQLENWIYVDKASGKWTSKRIPNKQPTQCSIPKKTLYREQIMRWKTAVLVFICFSVITDSNNSHCILIHKFTKTSLSAACGIYHSEEKQIWTSKYASIHICFECRNKLKCMCSLL